MNLSNIITLYHSGQLPRWVADLKQYEEILQNAEIIAFEAWQTNTNPTTCRMLVKEQKLYQKIQLVIRKKLAYKNKLDAKRPPLNEILPAFHNL